MAVNLDLAIAAVRSGRREEGRQLLNLLIQQNPNDDKAWLWMSSVVETDEQRARCLYHVLAIDPNSQIARRGLQLLGIVVSDSRPVKIPRDSQPIKIPNPSTPAQQAERRPFLIDPHAITQELPFTPVTAPFTPDIKASPAVLSIDVEAEAGQSQSGADNVSQKPPAPVPAPAQDRQQIPAPNPAPAPADTQPLPEPNQHPSQPVQAQSGVQQNPGQAIPSTPAQQSPSEPVPVASPHNQPNTASPVQSDSQPLPAVSNNPVAGQSPEPQNPSPSNPMNQQAAYPASQPGQPQAFGGQSVPRDTRPSEPVPVYSPGPQYSPPAQMPGYQANPPQQWPVQPGYGQNFHGNTTMGMPVPYQHEPVRPPSEPVSVYHPNTTFGMSSYSQNPMMPLHSSATMMMPSMSEAEARARLAASQAVPTSNAAAMALQNSAGQPGYPAHAGYAPAQPEEDEEEDEGVNVLAVVIFGTLSVTALGGLGMLILLMFTAPV